MSDEEVVSKTENISNLLDTARENIVSIYVNEFTEESAKSFGEDFLKAERSGQTIIPIIIDSYGGFVHALLPMLDIINSSKIPVATIGIGKAMSCGSVLISSGCEGMRYIYPNCSIMVHEVSNIHCGKNSELQADAEETNRLNDVLFKILDGNCGQPKGYWKNTLKENKNADLFLTAKKARRCGLVDVIGVPRIDVELVVKTKLIL